MAYVAQALERVDVSLWYLLNARKLVLQKPLVCMTFRPSAQGVSDEASNACRMFDSHGFVF